MRPPWRPSWAWSVPGPHWVLLRPLLGHVRSLLGPFCGTLGAVLWHSWVLWRPPWRPSWAWSVPGPTHHSIPFHCFPNPPRTSHSSPVLRTPSHFSAFLPTSLYPSPSSPPDFPHSSRAYSPFLRPPPASSPFFPVSPFYSIWPLPSSSQLVRILPHSALFRIPPHSSPLQSTPRIPPLPPHSTHFSAPSHCTPPYSPPSPGNLPTPPHCPSVLSSLLHSAPLDSSALLRTPPHPTPPHSLHLFRHSSALLPNPAHSSSRASPQQYPHSSPFLRSLLHSPSFLIIPPHYTSPCHRLRRPQHFPFTTVERKMFAPLRF